MCDTPSHGSDHLWLIWKESIQNCRCYRADTAGGTDGRTDGQTDGQTDGVKPIYPPTTSFFGGYNKTQIYRNTCYCSESLARKGQYKFHVPYKISKRFGTWQVKSTRFHKILFYNVFRWVYFLASVCWFPYHGREYGYMIHCKLELKL